jgi:hypothetical protein
MEKIQRENSAVKTMSETKPQEPCEDSVKVHDEGLNKEDISASSKSSATETVEMAACEMRNTERTTIVPDEETEMKERHD